jgi:hypothetical protein
LCAASALVHAQSTKPPATGLEPAWDIAVILEEVGANAAQLIPALDQLDPKSWVAKGASETYAEQWKSAREQARAVADEAKALAKSPERMSGELQLFFRIGGMERLLASVQEGARKYQGAASVQPLETIYAQGGANRERMRNYIVNLAAERERQFDVMDKEAQRCRATLMAAPPPPKTTGRKK